MVLSAADAGAGVVLSAADAGAGGAQRRRRGRRWDRGLEGGDDQVALRQREVARGLARDVRDEREAAIEAHPDPPARRLETRDRGTERVPHARRARLLARDGHVVRPDAQQREVVTRGRRRRDLHGHVADAEQRELVGRADDARRQDVLDADEGRDLRVAGA